MKIIKRAILFLVIASLVAIAFTIFRDKYNKPAQENVKLKKQLERIDQDHGLLKKEYDQELRKRLKLKNISDLRDEELEALKQEAARKEKEAQTLREELKVLSQPNKSTEELKEEIARKEKEAEALKLELNDLKSLNERSAAELEQQKQALEKSAELEQQRQALEKEKIKLENKIKEQEASLKRLKFERDKYKRRQY